jgi:hypothetical protein
MTTQMTIYNFFKNFIRGQVGSVMVEEVRNRSPRLPGTGLCFNNISENKKGEYGSFSVYKGYQIAVHSSKELGVVKDIQHLK